MAVNEKLIGLDQTFKAAPSRNNHQQSVGVYHHPPHPINLPSLLAVINRPLLGSQAAMELNQRALRHHTNCAIFMPLLQDWLFNQGHELKGMEGATVAA